jgi:hypothetical protein
VSDFHCVHVFESELHVIVDECHEHPTIETGGALFGLWTQGGAPVVMLATRPGPSARRHTTKFTQDAGDHNVVREFLWTRMGIQWIGLWHSHHQLNLHELSEGDVSRSASIADNHKLERFTDILCFFPRPRSGSNKLEVHVKPYLYTRASMGISVPTRLQVVPGQSPVRSQIKGGRPSLAPGKPCDFVTEVSSRISPYRRSAEDAASPQDTMYSATTSVVPQPSSVPLVTSTEAPDMELLREDTQADKLAPAFSRIIENLPLHLQEACDLYNLEGGGVRLSIGDSKHEGQITIDFPAEGERLWKFSREGLLGWPHRSSGFYDRDKSIEDCVKDAMRHLYVQD